MKVSIHSLLNSSLAATYVDDLITGNETVSEVFSFYLKAKEKLSEVGFTLQKFVTNSPELFDLIQRKEANNDKTESSEQVFSDENETYAKTGLNVNEKLTEQSETKVLGHVWNFQSDEICFQIKTILDIAEKTPLTKRGVLSIMAHVYDPLGLISPAMSRLKFLFRDLCKLDLLWDSPLPTKLKEQYIDWISSLGTISVLSIPGCYFRNISEDPISVELHGFRDASINSFAATVYLRIVTENQIETSLATSKNRLSPLVPQSVLGLELLAAVILARLITCARDALSSVFAIDHIQCWSDSLTVLFWLKNNTKDWKTFVYNRIGKIKRLTSVDCWNYVATNDNPADLPTRGTTFAELDLCDVEFKF